MKSVGEVMAIGGTFSEALLKGARRPRARREAPRPGAAQLRPRAPRRAPRRAQLGAPVRGLRAPCAKGWTVEEVSRITHIDPWFLREIRAIVELEAELGCWDLASVPTALLRRAKETGLSDAGIARLLVATPEELTAARKERGVRRVFKRVDTCAAEFPAQTPYLYSTFGLEDEAERHRPA